MSESDTQTVRGKVHTFDSESSENGRLEPSEFWLVRGASLPEFDCLVSVLEQVGG